MKAEVPHVVQRLGVSYVPLLLIGEHLLVSAAAQVRDEAETVSRQPRMIFHLLCGHAGLAIDLAGGLSLAFNAGKALEPDI